MSTSKQYVTSLPLKELDKCLTAPCLSRGTKYKVMIRVQKFKFEHRFESLETKNISSVIANLKGYKRVNGNLWLSTKFVGEYAIVDFLDINGNVVKTI